MYKENNSGQKTRCCGRLGKLLHCEQIVLLNLLCYERTFCALLDDAIKIEKTDVTSVSLDIITYNDMCRNCFSTCYNFWSDFKTIICGHLGKEDVNFRIVISSLKPYGSPLTRCLKEKDSLSSLHELEKSLLSDVVKNESEGEKIDSQSGKEKSEDGEKIVQFVNPWLFEQMVISVSEDISASVEKSTGIPEIELQGKRLMELEKMISNNSYSPPD